MIKNNHLNSTNYNPEPIPLRERLKKIIAFFLLCSVPALGWLDFLGWLASLGKERNLAEPCGYIFMRCPRCGHIYSTAEYKTDNVGVWIWYKCSKCKHLCKFRNIALLGGTIPEEIFAKNPYGE